jgi:hypothetical protein
MRMLALSLLALALFVLPAHAVTMYEYTGHPFTTWTGDTCAGNCNMTILMSRAEPFAPNVTASSNVTLRASFISASDGFSSYSIAEPAHLDDWFFFFATDQYGLPSQWVIGMEVWRAGPLPLFKVDTFNSVNCEMAVCGPTSGVFDGIQLRAPDERGGGEVTYRANNQGVVGTWRIVTVPEPMSLLLLAVGLAGVMVAHRLSRVHQRLTPIGP